MAIIRPKSAEQQRKQGWLILAVGAAIAIAIALGVSPTDFLGYN